MDSFENQRSTDNEIDLTNLTLAQLKDDAKMPHDDVDRDEQGMLYLQKLYRAKFAWAPKALVMSLSMSHYDQAFALVD